MKKKLAKGYKMDIRKEFEKLLAETNSLQIEATVCLYKEFCDLSNQIAKEGDDAKKEKALNLGLQVAVMLRIMFDTLYAEMKTINT